MKKGFTILETMVAILILTIGIIAVLQIFSLCANIQKSNEMENQAIFLAQEKMEQEIFKTYENIQIGTVLESPISSPYERFSRETKITYLSSDLEEVELDMGLKKIEVTVEWNAPLKLAQRSISIVNLVARR
jgi:prepilin-type N-terminal cleavage/methylation domain-containing protein